MKQQHDSPPLKSGETMAHGEDQQSLPRMMHTAGAGLQGSAFSFSENELKVKLTVATIHCIGISTQLLLLALHCFGWDLSHI